jgi:hypothetical protein
MTKENPIVLVVARYDLTDDARADLATAAQFFVDQSVNVYDAALLIADAWDQVQVQEWETRLPGNTPHFVRRALAGLIGGPVGAPPRPAHAPASAGSLSRRDLVEVGMTMAPVSTVLVVAAETGEHDALIACFPHAARIAQREIAADPSGNYLALGPTIGQMLRAG